MLLLSFILASCAFNSKLNKLRCFFRVELNGLLDVSYAPSGSVEPQTPNTHEHTNTHTHSHSLPLPLSLSLSLSSPFLHSALSFFHTYAHTCTHSFSLHIITFSIKNNLTIGVYLVRKIFRSLFTLTFSKNEGNFRRLLRYFVDSLAF